MTGETPTMWMCCKCESVCEGFAEHVPSPCDYCGSVDIVEMPIDTPAAPPKAPWNRQLAGVA
jgi:hypothetical protein